MRGRLFWKVSIGFWLTFAAISQGVTLLFALFHYQPSLTDQQVAGQIAPLVLDLCATTLAKDGPDGCRHAIGRLAPEDLPRLELRPVGAPTPAERAKQNSFSRRATAPTGQAYEIHYHYAPPPPWPTTLLGLPFEVLLLGCVGGLSFSALLAWYVIAPIRRVRRGFEELSRGKLSARVGHTVGRRVDELADLARDFDVMAARLGDLIAARDRLLHDVSHEIRSPLSRLQLAIGLARQDATRLPSSLTRIEQEVRRLDLLVNELLTLARVESGVTTTEEYFDLCGVIRIVARDARFEARDKGVDVRAHLPKDSASLPAVRGSSELIRRAIENVVRNALKFSPPEQSVGIEVRFDARQQEYLVRVADRGPGVPESALSTLFDPFVKAQDGGGGFGLGLSIAQRAIQAHGGRVAAANGARGGLVVTLALPASSETAHEPHDDKPFERLSPAPRPDASRPSRTATGARQAD